MLPGHHARQPSMSGRAKRFFAPVAHPAGKQAILGKIMMLIVSRKLHETLPQPRIARLFHDNPALY